MHSMRAIHIIAGLDRNQGGPSYSVPRLCTALRQQAVDTQIHTVRSADTPTERWIIAHKQNFAQIPVLRALRLSHDLARDTRAEALSADVFHTHGLWLMPNVMAGQVAARTGRPLIVSPRGMVAPEALAFSRWKKRFFWRLFQGPAYKQAAVWHATSSTEATEIRNFGIRSPIAIIPNGIDSPTDLGIRGTRKNHEQQILYLGRLHPKKGLPNLITAWSVVANERPDWKLVIVGPEESGYRAELQKIASTLGTKRVTFDGPIYGAEKSALLRNSDLFVLPTLNENFGIAVAEALAYGVPCIVSKGAPWSALEREQCGWWVSYGVDPLIDALRKATSLSDAERCNMGARGRAFVKLEYDWDRIALDMRCVYEWVLGKIARPSTVHID